MVTMTTDAERASAVAFARQNCALENMTPSDEALSLARRHMDGEISAQDLSVSIPHPGVADAVFLNTIVLGEQGWNPTGDLDELKTIHRRVFDGVFDDAGTVRTSNTRGKVGRAANPEAFFPVSLIETGAVNIATELSDKQNLRSLDRDVFIAQLAHIYDELGYLHPFIGGNAMTLRMFASRLSHDAGWDLDWGKVDAATYKAAKQGAYDGSTAGLESMFRMLVRPANLSRTFLIAGWEQGPAH
ncbi:MAG: Fic family protein [Bifidobacterium sp.]|uniref:protein adenylyltransferase n=1 Tax=Bifidobacterium fermentum TaxID=3059035 RepID=A0AB39UEZ9_9BIFI